jgi:hypothetical protein
LVCGPVVRVSWWSLLPATARPQGIFGRGALADQRKRDPIGHFTEYAGKILEDFPPTGRIAWWNDSALVGRKGGSRGRGREATPRFMERSSSPAGRRPLHERKRPNVLGNGDDDDCYLTNRMIKRERRDPEARPNTGAEAARRGHQSLARANPTTGDLEQMTFQLYAVAQR